MIANWPRTVLRYALIWPRWPLPCGRSASFVWRVRPPTWPAPPWPSAPGSQRLDPETEQEETEVTDLSWSPSKDSSLFSSRMLSKATLR